MGQAWHSRGGLNLPPEEHTALVVEPQSAKRAQVSGLLRNMGYRTYATGCGAVGQFIASQLSLEIVVVDADVPDMDGMQLIHQLRVRLPDAIIVATGTGDDWNEAASRAEAAGADFAIYTVTRETLASVLGEGSPPTSDPAQQHRN